jgi:hypothetical protein
MIYSKVLNLPPEPSCCIGSGDFCLMDRNELRARIRSPFRTNI